MTATEQSSSAPSARSLPKGADILYQQVVGLRMTAAAMLEQCDAILGQALLLAHADAPPAELSPEDAATLREAQDKLRQLQKPQEHRTFGDKHGVSSSPSVSQQE